MVCSYYEECIAHHFEGSAILNPRYYKICERDEKGIEGVCPFYNLYEEGLKEVLENQIGEFDGSEGTDLTSRIAEN